MSSQLMRVVASSVAVANHAGKKIRSIMQSGELGVVDKGGCGEFDPQTEADRSAQSIIVGSLTKQFPGLKVVGEEEDVDVPTDGGMIVSTLDEQVLTHACPENFKDLNIEDLVVWVDPLDGTTEFTKGHVEHVTILIGVSAHGRAIGGIVHQPFFTHPHTQEKGRTLWGVTGVGAFGVNRVEVPAGRRKVVTTLSHSTESVQQAIDALNVDEVLRVGGCGYKTLLVVEGFADAYVFATPGTKKWDTCAPEAIIRAMGGKMTDMLNEDIDYSRTEKKWFMNWRGLLATYRDHDSYAQNIPEDIKRTLQQTHQTKTA